VLDQGRGDPVRGGELVILGDGLTPAVSGRVVFEVRVRPLSTSSMSFG